MAYPCLSVLLRYHNDRVVGVGIWRLRSPAVALGTWAKVLDPRDDELRHDDEVPQHQPRSAEQTPTKAATATAASAHLLQGAQEHAEPLPRLVQQGPSGSEPPSEDGPTVPAHRPCGQRARNHDWGNWPAPHACGWR